MYAVITLDPETLEEYEPILTELKKEVEEEAKEE